MKIVYVSYSAIPLRAANGVHIMKVCQAMAQLGHEVILVVPDKKWECEKGIHDLYHFYGVKKCFEIKKLFCPPIKGKKLFFCFLAVLLIKKLRPDIIYTRCVITAYLSFFYKTPVICEQHKPMASNIDLFCFKRLIRSKRLKRFIVISDALKRCYRKKFPGTGNRLMVLADGADPVSENIVPINILSSGKRLLVGYTGQLYAGRGMEIILRLAQLCPWAEFHIIGGMPIDISYWKERMRAMNNIQVHGYIPHREICRYLLSFDVLLAPYQKRVSIYAGKRQGGFGNTEKWMSPLKIFEYMAAGKAILASDLPVLREVLTHKKNALLVSPGNVDDWKNALIRIKKDVTLREHLGLQSKTDLLEKYSWEKRVKQVLKEIK